MSNALKQNYMCICVYICVCMCTKSLQSFLTLCYPMDCSLPGSSVHGVLQERILEWVAMSSSRGSSQSRDWIHIPFVFCIGRQVLYHLCHLGRLQGFRVGNKHLYFGYIVCVAPLEWFFFMRTTLDQFFYHIPWKFIFSVPCFWWHSSTFTL